MYTLIYLYIYIYCGSHSLTSCCFRRVGSADMSTYRMQVCIHVCEQTLCGAACAVGADNSFIFSAPPPVEVALGANRSLSP